MCELDGSPRLPLQAGNLSEQFRRDSAGAQEDVRQLRASLGALMLQVTNDTLTVEERLGAVPPTLPGPTSMRRHSRGGEPLHYM